jgi:hypothetical protein
MAFVDGENLTLRGQSLAQKRSLDLKEGPYWRKDVFIWVPEVTADTRWIGVDLHLHLATKPLRAHYYTSVQGDNTAIQEVREALHRLRFAPKVIQKMSSQRSSKGVDISLATDMLVNAFQGNYDVALLYAGDGDYVPLVEELKRMGKVVYLVFFAHEGLSNDLRLACDHFVDLTHSFSYGWGGTRIETVGPSESLD